MSTIGAEQNIEHKNITGIRCQRHRSSRQGLPEVEEQLAVLVDCREAQKRTEI